MSDLIHGHNPDATESTGLIREVHGITGEPNYIFSHQREAVELFCQRLRKTRWICNGADMGLGKTLMKILLYGIYCVEATNQLSLRTPLRPIDRTGGWKLLIVGPKSMPTSWFEELTKWTWFGSPNILLEESSDRLEASLRKCIDDTDDQVAVVLTTYDIVRLTYLKAHHKTADPLDANRTVWERKPNTPLPALFEWMTLHDKKLMVVFDESHDRLRNPDSQTTVAHQALMRCAPNSKGILTSGTAFNNRPTDLMSQMRAIGDQSQYTQPEAWHPNGRDHKIVSIDAINYWRDHMIAIPASVLSLPKLHQVVVEVNVNNDPLIPWDAYQTLVDEARSAFSFQQGEAASQRLEKSAKLIAALRKLDLMLIHPNLIRYNAPTLKAPENAHLLDEMVRRPTAYLHDCVEVVMAAYNRGERSLIVTSESVTVLMLIQRVVDVGFTTQGLHTKNYLYVGSLDMTARLKMQHAFGQAANAPLEDNPTTMHICYLSMQAGANGITLLGPRTMLKVPPGSFNPAISRQVDKRFHRIGVRHEVQVVSLRVRGSAAHAIASVNEDKDYLSGLTTNLNTLGDGDGDSFGCTPLTANLDKNIEWKIKGTYAQNLWNWDVRQKQLTSPSSD